MNYIGLFESGRIQSSLYITKHPTFGSLFPVYVCPVQHFLSPTWPITQFPTSCMGRKSCWVTCLLNVSSVGTPILHRPQDMLLCSLLLQTAGIFSSQSLEYDIVDRDSCPSGKLLYRWPRFLVLRQMDNICIIYLRHKIFTILSKLFRHM